MSFQSKEVRQAVEWLEQDYSLRDSKEILDGPYRPSWKLPPRYNPDGTPLHHDRDMNVYRRGFYEERDDVYVACGEPNPNAGDPGESDTIECWCHAGAPPKYVTSLDWSPLDEAEWLESGENRGVYNVYREHLREVHSYLFSPEWEELPDNIDWWRED